MYTYKNKVTGAVVSTFGKVTGGDWVQVKGKAKAANDAKDDEKESDGE